LCDQLVSDISLPTSWAKNVRSAVLHVICLAQFALIYTRGWAANVLNPRARQAAATDRLTNEVALLQEELRIKDARIAKLDPRRRPHYPATERMAILELKDEGFRRVLIPLNLRKMREEANAIIAWYKTCRPHTALGGRTPDECYRRVASACRRPRWEPRPHWPSDSSCAFPQVKVRGKQGVNLQLVVDFHQGRKHLPVVTLRPVA
jgi:hypothetical protein